MKRLHRKDGLYARRTAGRHRHHRAADLDPAAVTEPRPRDGEPREVRQQPASDRPGHPALQQRQQGRLPAHRCQARPIARRRPRTCTWGTGHRPTRTSAPAARPFHHRPAARTTTSPPPLFLLLRTQDITSEVFTCPSSNAEKDTVRRRHQRRRSTGPTSPTSRRTVSYSYQNPYPGTQRHRRRASS